MVETVNGVAVTTFTAGQTLGEATIFATTGEITGRLHLQLFSTQAPVANFAANPYTGPAPLAVQFTDHTLWGATSWLWNFGDGNTSTQQNPTHLYSQPGSYTVSLTVSNLFGEDTMVKEDFIIVVEGTGSMICIPLLVR